MPYPNPYRPAFSADPEREAAECLRFIEAAQFPFCESLARVRTTADDQSETIRSGMTDTGMKLGDVERDLVLQALERTGWNVTRAAQLLGVTRDTLRYRMEKHRIRPSA